MKLCAIEPKELEEKILIRFAENQNDELLEDLSDYVINSQKEIERLNENNQAMQEEMARTWEKLDKKENIIKEVRELLNKYDDNESNYYVPVDIALEILDKEKE